MPVGNTSTAPSTGSFLSKLGTSEHPADPNRYHLYVGLFCPFAHRVLLTRELKGLQSFLPLSVVQPYPKEPDGWRFPSSDGEYLGSTVDHLFGSKLLQQVYFKAKPDYVGKYSVPVLWDKEKNTIVNNESEDIMRMLNTAFNDYLPKDSEKRELDFYPAELRKHIDEINSWMGPELNIGVYKAGFATTQEEYSKNCEIVFSALDRLEPMLAQNTKTRSGPYLLGKQLTEVDLKLYTTLVRFDTAYGQHFKLNIRTIRHDYPHLNRWLKHLYWKVPGFKETTDFKHIKEGYTKSHARINPHAITPLGPRPDVEAWTEEDEQWLKE